MYTTIKETKKALQLETSEGKQFWIQRRWMRGDGSLTPQGQAAADKASKPDPDAPKKKPYKICKPAEVRSVSDKAVVIVCYNGQKDVLPVSQIIDAREDDAIYVPTWLADQKDIQVADKVYWI